VLLYIKQRKWSDSLRRVLWMILFFVFLLLMLSQAGIRIDGSGNIISEDVIAPSGGNRMIDGQGHRVNASAGQVSAGLSASGSGSKLYHGVHAPRIYLSRVNDWGLINH